eukprot:TRINITY_DN8642_c0_g1_i2.p2 TRINITY_DN8642_c0_g1~~TRINITY_DN8642_c0_g1_i2.p2  ORF type:complete len:158 (-),score=41.58 TRINITY_DN8642_c0_g1_i2:241-714(-)
MLSRLLCAFFGASVAAAAREGYSWTAEAKTATWKISTTNKGQYKECDTQPGEGDPITVVAKSRLTNGTTFAEQHEKFHWHAHKLHDHMEVDDSKAKLMGLELFQYVPAFTSMCVGEQRRVELIPKKGNALNFFEFDMKKDIGAICDIELVSIGHDEL